MSVSTADVSAILKENYGSAPADQLNHEVRALSHFEKSEDADWVGEVFVEALHTGRNYSTKAVAQRGQLPASGRQAWGELRVPDRYVYGAISITAQAMSEPKGKGTFINVLAAEIDGMVRDLKVTNNRMIWGFGDGVMALVNGDMTGGSTTVPVDTPGGVVGSVNGARFIRPGMVLAFHAAAPGSNTPLAVRTVVSVAADGSSIVVDSSLDETTAPDNGVITMGVSRNGTLEGSWQLEPMGILGLVDDGTFKEVLHSLNRTNNPIFKSNVFSNVGSLDELIFWRAFDACDEMAGAEPNWLVCHHSVHREYIKISLPDKRYSGEDLKRPDVGISGGGKKHELTFSGTDIEKERYCPYGTFFGIDDSRLKKYTNEEGKWIDEDGAILVRRGTTDEFDATYRQFRNNGILQCNSSFILRDINANIDIVNAL